MEHEAREQVSDEEHKITKSHKKHKHKRSKSHSQHRGEHDGKYKIHRERDGSSESHRRRSDRDEKHHKLPKKKHKRRHRSSSESDPADSVIDQKKKRKDAEVERGMDYPSVDQLELKADRESYRKSSVHLDSDQSHAVRTDTIHDMRDTFPPVRRDRQTHIRKTVDQDRRDDVPEKEDHSFDFSKHKPSLNRIFFRDHHDLIQRGTKEYEDFWAFLQKYQLYQKKKAEQSASKGNSFQCFTDTLNVHVCILVVCLPLSAVTSRSIPFYVNL